MKTILSRVAFCQHCYDNYRPQKGNRFVVVGSTSKKEKFRSAYRHGVRGFTPHFVILEKVVDQQIHYAAVCAIHGCGIDIYIDNNDTYQWFFFEEKAFTGILTIKEWNAWTKFKDAQYRI